MDVLRGTEAAMHWIIQANIDRFNEMLKTETDPVKRGLLARLRVEEEVKRAHEPKDKKAAF
jgi:hypothetical protein